MPTLAKPTMKPVTSWSFSRYNDYKTCPAMFMYKHCMGLREPGNEAMQRGSDIHTLAERYAKAPSKPKLPTELSLFSEEFEALRKQKVKFVEDSWTWTRDWAGETTWNDWNGAWLRVKLDAAYINVAHNAAVIIDHKTGKIRDYKTPEYLEQLELYGLAGLKKFPDVKIVAPVLWYLDEGVIFPNGDNHPEIEYTRADEPKLQKAWAVRIKPMFTDKTFKPKPGNNCTWCHFRKSNKGPCKY